MLKFPAIWLLENTTKSRSLDTLERIYVVFLRFSLGIFFRRLNFSNDFFDALAQGGGFILITIIYKHEGVDTCLGQKATQFLIWVCIERHVVVRCTELGHG